MKLDGATENGRASTSGFKTVSERELSRLIENNSNTNMKHSTSPWLKLYKKWAEHRGMQTNLAFVAKDRLDGVLQQFYAELVKRMV